MKGTEKQVKWAEDIIAGARDILAQMISQNEERAAELGAAMYAARAEQWKKLSAQVEAAIEKCDDAAIIINKRNMFSFDGLRKWADRM